MSLREKLDEWLWKNLSGHTSLGPVTVYGFNNMHVAVNIWTKRFGAVCFHPDLRFLGSNAPWMLGKDWPWYFYMSPDYTPGSATFAIGPGMKKDAKLDAFRRWLMWGHNYRNQDPRAEREFFWSYVRDAVSKRRADLEENVTCGACGVELSSIEAVNSNVCLKCLLAEMERVASTISEMESGGRPEVH